jgi:hypothetical protein
MLGHSDEDAGWKCHVEDTIGLLPALLELLEVFP